MTNTLYNYKASLSQKPGGLTFGADKEADVTTDGNIKLGKVYGVYYTSPFDAPYFMDEYEAYELMVWLQGLGLRPRPVKPTKRTVKRVSPWWKFWKPEFKMVEDES